MKIGIRCDCGPAMGMGHIARQILIKDILLSHGHEVHFFIKEGISIASSLGLVTNDVEIERMDCLLIDILENFENFDFKGKKIIFHDRSKKTFCNADAVFALNRLQDISWYGPRYYVGCEYIPMEPSIALVQKNYGKLKNILIMAGGLDRWNIPSKIVDAIGYMDYRISVKLSQAYPVDLRQSLKNVELIDDIDRVSNLYEEYDLMICTAGNVLFEAAAAGLPCISFSTCEIQEEHGVGLQKEGFSIHLGGFWDNTANIAALPSTIEYLSNSNVRRDRGKIGKKFCDGKGLNKIINIIEDLL